MQTMLGLAVSVFRSEGASVRMSDGYQRKDPQSTMTKSSVAHESSIENGINGILNRLVLLEIGRDVWGMMKQRSGCVQYLHVSPLRPWLVLTSSARIARSLGLSVKAMTEL